MTIFLLDAPQTAGFAADPATGSQRLSFGRFDPSLGVLGAAIVTLSTTATGSAQIENLQVTPAQVTGSLSGSVVVSDPTGAYLVAANPGNLRTATLAAYDGTVDAAGPSGTTLTMSSPVTQSSTLVLSRAQIAAMSGVGTVDIAANLSNFRTSVSGGGNLFAQTNVAETGAVKLQYGYVSADPNATSPYGSIDVGGGVILTNSLITDFFILLQGEPDPRIATPIQTRFISDQTTDWTQKVTFAKFDPTLGKLDDIIITVTSDIASSFDITNVGPAGSFYASVGANVGVGAYYNTALLTAAPSVSWNGDLGAVGSGSNTSYVRQTGTIDVNTRDIFADSDLAAFTGPGGIDLTAFATAIGNIGGPSSYSARLLTQAGETIEVHYLYEPGVANPTRAAPTAQSAAAACFAAGTRILTDHGERPIEAIAVGDRVITHRGDSAKVVWCGRRTVTPARQSNPWDVNPVYIAPGAFGPGAPARDLVLSPDHAIFFRGALIPIRLLINGRSIRQRSVAKITWHHIELTTHDVVLAENLPAESYLDTGNRSAFEGDVMDLNPRFSGIDADDIWRHHACARQVRDGADLRAARLHLRLIAAQQSIDAGRARQSAKSR